MVISLWRKKEFRVRPALLSCPIANQPASSKCYRCSFYKTSKCPRPEEGRNNVITLSTAKEDFAKQAILKPRALHPIAQTHTP
jgi:hypothetical protein